MNLVTKSIVRKGENLILTNQRALYWESQHTLVLSDLHIGKAAHFRKHGIPIPINVLHADLKRLKIIIDFFAAKSLTIVGDMFHAGVNGEIQTFKKWKDSMPSLSIDLIKGNHDRLKGTLYEDLNLNVYQLIKHIEPITLIHDHKPSETNSFCISGHTHPGVSIKLKGKQRIKLPCYQVSEHHLVLPAFSDFTGLNTKACPVGTKCYAFTNTAIFEV